ncbi:GLPGLI family protein [Maribacter sp. 2304DJ31-5]|uniref:GLPGLI family protein n=1 Tax=Maribacter sp. 2304DJ31-5 TaxID=3386273 RepID=UPI0039BD6AAE
MKNLRLLLLLIVLFPIINRAQEKQLVLDYTLTNCNTLKAKATIFKQGQLDTVFGQRPLHPEGAIPGVPMEVREEDMRYETYHILLFKEYPTKTLKHHVSLKKDIDMVLQQKMDLFDWKITFEKETILGLQCQQAKAHYKGRDYTAYFTTKLNFKGGPWKFHGLPGVILKVGSDDGHYFFEATAYRIVSTNKKIKDPFADTKTVDWEWYYNKSVQIIDVKSAKYKRKIQYSCNGDIEKFPFSYW